VEPAPGATAGTTAYPPANNKINTASTRRRRPRHPTGEKSRHAMADRPETATRVLKDAEFLCCVQAGPGGLPSRPVALQPGDPYTSWLWAARVPAAITLHRYATSERVAYRTVPRVARTLRLMWISSVYSTDVPSSSDAVERLMTSLVAFSASALVMPLTTPDPKATVSGSTTTPRVRRRSEESIQGTPQRQIRETLKQCHELERSRGCGLGSGCGYCG
jgi:hypothetical protein